MMMRRMWVKTSCDPQTTSCDIHMTHLGTILLHISGVLYIHKTCLGVYIVELYKFMIVKENLRFVLYSSLTWGSL